MKKNDENTFPYVIYCDMDGVLVDLFDNGVYLETKSPKIQANQMIPKAANNKKKKMTTKTKQDLTKRGESPTYAHKSNTKKEENKFD